MHMIRAALAAAALFCASIAAHAQGLTQNGQVTLGRCNTSSPYALCLHDSPGGQWLGVGSFNPTAHTFALLPSTFPSLTGDVTSTAGTINTTITPSAVTLPKMANLPAFTVIGNINGSSSTPQALTSAQLCTLLPQACASTSILTSASGVSGSGQQTTGTINAASNVLTLAAAIDFQTNQGILVNHAGAAFSGAAATGLTAVQQGVTGSTSYQYALSSCDSNGGVGASQTVTVSNGNATLTGANDIQISWLDHGAGCYVLWRNIASAGWQMIASTAGQVVGSNQIWNDNGQSNELLPFWIPSSPPGSAVSDWLVTTISSGGGTTSLSLGANATTTATTTAVMHDDTATMNAWIASINANCGGTAAAVTNTKIRVSKGLNPITCSNTYIEGNGALIMPAGAGNFSGIQAVFNLQGPGQTGLSGSLNCPEGQNYAITDVSQTLIQPGGYVVLTAPAPGGVGLWTHISPVKTFTGGTQVGLFLPCPASFYDYNGQYTITGTPVVGATISITMTGVPGGTVNQSFLVASGDTTTTIAHKIANALNGSAGLDQNLVSSWDNGTNIVYYGYPRNAFTATLSLSDSSSALTFTGVLNTTYSSIATFTPATGNTIDGWTADGTNIGNNESNEFYFIYGVNLADTTVSNIKASNFWAGSGVFLTVGYNNTLSNIFSTNDGDLQTNGISLTYQTLPKGTNWTSDRDSGFGIGFGSVSYGNFSNLSAGGCQNGRAIKLADTLQSSFSNLSAINCQRVGLAITWGSYKNNFTGVVALGNNSWIGASEGIWFSDSFDRHNNIVNATAWGNGTDISSFSSDIQNTFINASFQNVSNGGFADFQGGSPLVTQFVPVVGTGAACTNGSVVAGTKNSFQVSWTGTASSCQVNLPPEWQNGFHPGSPFCSLSQTTGSTPVAMSIASPQSLTLAGSFVNGESVYVQCRQSYN